MLSQVSAQIGRVGINTTSPAAMLHVKDSSVVFSGTSSLPGSPSNPPISGGGKRMMWYADKAAFRAGVVAGTHWDKDSIGTYSFASGINNVARGSSSACFGSNNVVYGTSSLSIGGGNVVYGSNSLALGFDTGVTGSGSISSGYQSSCGGSGSFISGWFAQNNGDYSISCGSQTQVTGDNSICAGTVSGVSGVNSIAVGNSCFAMGAASAAFGLGSSASGVGSLAGGSFTNASGENAFSHGSSTDATGISSLAIGDNTWALGNYAVSMGSSTIANAFSSFVAGQFNVVPSANNAAWVLTDPLFTIGNGLDNANTSNALTILKNAKTGINTATPDAMLHVIKDVPTNGPYNSSSAAIFEGDQGAFIQLSTNQTIQNGILSGSNLTSLRSALIFTPDSSVQIRAGGNNTKLFVRNDGNVGIGTLTPLRRLHVVNGSSGATPLTSSVAVFEDDANAYISLLTPSIDESGIFFGNPASNAHGGIVYNATVANGLAFRTNGNSTKMVINDVGRVGINDNSPDARLHVSEGAGGGIYNTAAEVIIEDNDASYIQFSVPTIEESGILSGNASMSLRSGIIFRADSSVQIRAGGSNTRLAVTKTGNIGVGTLSPAAKLDVNGNTILGTNGTVLTEVIKATVTKDVASVAANSTLSVDFAVTNAATTSTVYISPQNELTSGLIIAYARVSAANNVRVRFTNTTGAAIDPASMDYYITVIR
jgi:hypothetical protein